MSQRRIQFDVLGSWKETKAFFVFFVVWSCHACQAPLQNASALSPEVFCRSGNTAYCSWDWDWPHSLLFPELVPEPPCGHGLFQHTFYFWPGARLCQSPRSPACHSPHFHVMVQVAVQGPKGLSSGLSRNQRGCPGVCPGIKGDANLKHAAILLISLLLISLSPGISRGSHAPWGRVTWPQLVLFCWPGTP